MKHALLKFVAAAIALGLCFSFEVQAHEYKLGALEIKHPWSRATPGGAKIGGGYMTLINRGATPDRLVSVSSPAAGKVELHEMTTQDGIMKMRPLSQGVPIEPGDTVALKPGGMHVMFVNLKAPLKQGESVAARLVFEKAGALDVTFKVEAMGSGGEHAHPAH
jgi:copper(I)-binding protein